MAGSGSKFERLRKFLSGKSRAVRAKVLVWWEPGPVQLASATLVLVVFVGGAVALVSTIPGAAGTGMPSADGRYAVGALVVPVEDATRERSLEAWLHDLGDPTPRVRWTAVQELGRRGARDQDTGEIVAALIDTLKKDDHFMVRADAATALGAIGPDADDAVTALIAAAEDPAAAVRAAALGALPLIKPSPDAVTRR
jgi:hypothetical protein